jgi:SAM-dependent methyltransferase
MLDEPSGRREGAILAVVEERKNAERQFFDAVYAKKPARPTALKVFYGIAAGGARYRAAIAADVSGKDVLEYGCGATGHAADLASRGARVVGVDIAPAAIELARERAAATPHLPLRFEVGDAENLPFPDGSFDRVCGSGILHHLDIARAAHEVRRVLRPGGDAFFFEPMAYNPVGALFRVLTPHKHTPDEHPLVRADFDRLEREFGRVDAEFFSAISSAAIPLLALPGGKTMFAATEAVDRALLSIPGVRWLGGFVVLSLSSPRQR